MERVHTLEASLLGGRRSYKLRVNGDGWASRPQKTELGATKKRRRKEGKI